MQFIYNIQNHTCNINAVVIHFDFTCQTSVEWFWWNRIMLLEMFCRYILQGFLCSLSSNKTHMIFFVIFFSVGIFMFTHFSSEEKIVIYTIMYPVETFLNYFYNKFRYCNIMLLIYLQTKQFVFISIKIKLQLCIEFTKISCH